MVLFYKNKLQFVEQIYKDYTFHLTIKDIFKIPTKQSHLQNIASSSKKLELSVLIFNRIG